MNNFAWIAVDKNGNESIHLVKPSFYGVPAQWITPMACEWNYEEHDHVFLPKGSIEKIIGRKITFEESPIQLTDD